MQVVDTFERHTVKRLKSQQFNLLPFKTKRLIHHLAEAGHYGRDIFYKQNYIHNILIRDFLESVFKNISTEFKEDNKTLLSSFSNYLKLIWFHCGIHNDRTNEKHKANFTNDDLISISENALQTNPEHLEGLFSSDELVIINKIIFCPEFAQYKKTPHKEDDLLLKSSVNFYDGNISNKTFEEYFNNKYPKKDNSPQFGFNSNFYLNECGSIEERRWCANGMYSKEILNIIKELDLAKEFAENEEQAKSISTLIDFYKSGEPSDFDKHSLAWVEDKNSEIYYVNGFIEPYSDPKGIHCTYESILAIKDHTKSSRIETLCENADFFEEILPIDDKYRRTEVSGMSASASIVLSMSGDCAPATPLGICLPNSERIRENVGSKSVVFSNVGGGTSAADEAEVHEFMENTSLANEVVKLAGAASEIHTDLHELLGHGSGRLAKGKSIKDLDDLYSIIEETRADLVGLYFIRNPRIYELGLLSNIAEANAYYQHYITNGLIYQLKRVEPGKTITQTHMRNRHLISSWAIAKDTKSEAIRVSSVRNKKFFTVTNHDKLQEIFGDMLFEIQRIKSEGDYVAAKALIESYGTTIDQTHHKEVLERYKTINYSIFTGFLTPQYRMVADSSGVLDDIVSETYNDFVEEQLALSEKYRA